MAPQHLASSPSLFHRFVIILIILLTVFSQECSALKIQGVSTDTSRVRYDRHQVWRVTPQLPKHISLLERLQKDTRDLDFWGDIKLGSPTDIRVPPGSTGKFRFKLQGVGLDAKIHIEDVQRLIDEEQGSNKLVKVEVPRVRRSLDPAPVDKMLFYWFNVIGRYVRHQEMNDWLELATYSNPDICTTFNIGKSGLGKTLKVLKVGSKAPHGKLKPAIWVDGGTHAREWVSPATAAYIIFQLLDKYGTDTNITALVDNFDWYILPIANPDGYEYSHTVDRLWRKTRSTQPGSKCVGVDINRNFDFHWKDCDSLKHEKCGSTSPCQATFAGSRPFSEPETMHIAGFLVSMRERLLAYFSLHAYAQMWLTPWSYTKTLPDNHQHMMDITQIAVEAIRAEHGETFTAGTSANTLYMAGGSAQDWVKGLLGVNHSYIVELRDKGQYGFFLPRHLILPSASEVWAGIQALGLYLLHF